MTATLFSIALHPHHCIDIYIHIYTYCWLHWFWIGIGMRRWCCAYLPIHLPDCAWIRDLSSLWLVIISPVLPAVSVSDLPPGLHRSSLFAPRSSHIVCGTSSQILRRSQLVSPSSIHAAITHQCNLLTRRYNRFFIWPKYVQYNLSPTDGFILMLNIIYLSRKQASYFLRVQKHAARTSHSWASYDLFLGNEIPIMSLHAEKVRVMRSTSIVRMCSTNWALAAFDRERGNFLY